jgi:hypothetical protein
MPAKRLTVQQRREIFLALVRIQDEGTMTVGESLQHIMKEYAISESQLKQIEEEGIDKEWPPLDEAVETVAESE